MGTLAILILTGIIIFQFTIIVALLNRVLIQAKVAPIELKPKSDTSEEPQEPPRRKLFGMQINA